MNAPATTIRRRQAFTLVELLVVITIIAVLAAMGFAGAQAAINRANRTQALQVCTNLTQAIVLFYDEYGALPDIETPTEEIKTNDENGKKLLAILTGTEATSDTMQNPKQIRFFQAKEAKGAKTDRPKGGIVYDADGKPKGLYDPWGSPYRVRLDTDYDEQIKDPFLTDNTVIRGVRALAYSFGKNDTNDKGKGDDVKTW